MKVIAVAVGVDDPCRRKGRRYTKVVVKERWTKTKGEDRKGIR